MAHSSRWRCPAGIDWTGVGHPPYNKCTHNDHAGSGELRVGKQQSTRTTRQLLALNFATIAVMSSCCS